MHKGRTFMTQKYLPKALHLHTTLDINFHHEFWRGTVKPQHNSSTNIMNLETFSELKFPLKLTTSRGSDKAES